MITINIPPYSPYELKNVFRLLRVFLYLIFIIELGASGSRKAAKRIYAGCYVPYISFLRNSSALSAQQVILLHNADRSMSVFFVNAVRNTGNSIGLARAEIEDQAHFIGGSIEAAQVNAFEFFAK